jgi:hypothetical protein
MEDLVRGKELASSVREEVQELLNELETTVVKKKETYHSVFNQPERITLSTANAEAQTEVTNATSESSAYQFTINLPRPALNVASIQLLYANIPQAQVCIPDSSCAFWYYRLRTTQITWPEWNSGTTYFPGQSIKYTPVGQPEQNYTCISQNINKTPGLIYVSGPYWKRSNTTVIERPNLNALYMIRLLPSYYKQELITNPQLYGYNQTFNTYQAVADQLDLASANDLAYNNNGGNFRLFEPNDISIPYNTSTNRFEFLGQQVATPYNIPGWDTNTIYPPQTVVEYMATGVYYISQVVELGTNPSISQGSWTAYTSTIWNTYLVASSYDPNVIIAQGKEIAIEWNPYHNYNVGEYADYNGLGYIALQANTNQVPGEPSRPYFQLTANVGEVTSPTSYSALPTVSTLANGLLTATQLPRTTVDAYIEFTFTISGFFNDTGVSQMQVGIYPPAFPVAYAEYSIFLISTSTTNTTTVQYGVGVYSTTAVEGDTFTFKIIGSAVTYYKNGILLPSTAQSVTKQYYSIFALVASAGGTNTMTIKDISLRSLPVWTLSSPGAELTGLNGLSQRLDFPYLPDTIPGQPYIDIALSKNNTLNSILGFTWNGQNMNLSYVFDNLGQVGRRTLGGLLVNRLRPVPKYYIVSGVAGELDEPFTFPGDTSGTYTADAFGNLVFSSVVNVYTRIVGGSTTDTQQNTNLLAIVPMACGNLGVTFTGSFIDNPLTKMDKDIYSLNILLYTERNEPYWISNNGIATFTLKLTYEE